MKVAHLTDVLRVFLITSPIQRNLQAFEQYLTSRVADRKIVIPQFGAAHIAVDTGRLRRSLRPGRLALLGRTIHLCPPMFSFGSSFRA